MLPQYVHFAGPVHPSAAALPNRALEPCLGVSPVPEPEGYLASVAEAVRSLRAGELRKVVLARALQLTFAETIGAEGILSNLVKDNAHGYTFAADLPPRAGDAQRTLIGSSPELLLSRTGTDVISHPLAGSAPRSPDPATDRANAESLLDSAKDQVEHALVIDAVTEILGPFCRNLAVPAEPSLTSTSTMWHLGTRVTGELIDPDVSALTLATRLHPTPAICGTPRQAAREAIEQLEPFDRNYYAGIVGWCDAAGDGQWAIAIRCADVEDRALRLFAGAGIVEGSEPDLELAETSAKFQTLLRAMGLDLEL
ncbi:MAG: isochorismate synthase [Pseudonocardiaceae bacterium]|nr:isochorismate synthase [Pseudonocardiaceae bacterium]